MKQSRKQGIVHVPVDGQAANTGDAQAPELNLDVILKSKNICDEIGDEHSGWLADLGKRVVDECRIDEDSRIEWMTRMNEAIKVARQISEEKSFPWPGAANIKFPLITIAALQWHARAYALLLPPGEIVQYRTYGQDPNGEKNKLGLTISKHMTWQLEEEDESWEDEQDKTLLIMAIMGDAFKKTYFDPVEKRNVSRLVMPQDLVVDYWTKGAIENAQRISHLIEFSENAIYERQAIGVFRDIDLPRDSTTAVDNQNTATKNISQGTQPPISDKAAPSTFIEQHRWEDIDGDGYKEPYVVTVHRQSMTVMRIVARFTGKRISYATDAKGAPTKTILRIEPVQCFTKYPFIPAFDGGFYDVGFGLLLGHMNEAVSTLINQLLDAGTMSNTSGGFLGRGIKIRGGNMYFKPNEWKQVDSPGSELKNNIVPLPVREPSNVLFQLLNLLINYGERIAGATDIQVGQTPDQNTPASTSRMAEANGLRVFGAIFKRTYRALKKEFRKLYVLNSIYLDDMPKNPFALTAQDYETDERSICPSADPHVMSDAVRTQRAEALVMAAGMPGPPMDLYQVKKRFLESHQIQNIDQVMPDPKGPNAIPPPPNPKMLEIEIKQKAQQLKEMDFQLKTKMAIANLLQEMDLNAAHIQELEAKASMEAAKGDAAKLGQIVEMANVELGVAKMKQEGRLESVKILHDIIKTMGEANAGNSQESVQGVGAAPGNGGAAPSDAGAGGGSLGALAQ